jgi:hypothetical protein
MRYGLVGGKFGLHLLRCRPLEGDEGALIAHGVAVVGSGEYCDAFAVVAHLVPLVLYLVTSNDVVHSVGLKEVLGDVGPELATDSTLGRRASPHWLRITPEELTHDSILWRLTVSLGLSDVV